MAFYGSLKNYIRLWLLRLLTSLLGYSQRRRAHTQGPTFWKTAVGRQSKPGKIGLAFYTPAGYEQKGLPSSGKTYPLVVNFHPGGFSVGGPRDDEVWAASLTKLGVVVVAVDYRLAPEHPLPTAFEDGLDALLWLWDHAVEYQIDSRRTVLTGFSAGATMTMSLPILMQEKLGAAGMKSLNGTIKGISAHYPSLDWSKSREEKIAMNPISRQHTMKSTSELFDWAVKDADKTDPVLSPARCPDEELKTALPHRIALYTCGADMLLTEGEDMRSRLAALGKHVGGGLIPDVPHYWDHMVRTAEHRAKRDLFYGKAAREVREMLES